MFNAIKNKILSVAVNKLIEKSRKTSIQNIISELQIDRGIFTFNEIQILKAMRQLGVNHELDYQYFTSNSELLSLCMRVYNSYMIAESMRNEFLSDNSILSIMFSFFVKYEGIAHLQDQNEQTIKQFIDKSIEYETEQYILSGVSRYPAIQLPPESPKFKIREALASINR